MNEVDAYTQLLMMVGIILCLPFLLCRTVPFLVSHFVACFFPPKYIELELRYENGNVVKKKISLENDKELVSALLKAKEAPNE